jgi:hypothetical protein
MRTQTLIAGALLTLLTGCGAQRPPARFAVAPATSSTTATQGSESAQVQIDPLAAPAQVVALGMTSAPLPSLASPRFTAAVSAPGRVTAPAQAVAPVTGPAAPAAATSAAPAASPALALAQAAAAGPAALPAAPSPYSLPAGAETVLSPTYLRVRERYLSTFFHQGMSAESFSPQTKELHFGDQTIYQGFALLAFAGEARLLMQAGLDPSGSEALVRRLLAAFDELDDAAERDLYGDDLPGAFVRDRVDEGAHRRGIPAGWHVASDYASVAEGKAKFRSLAAQSLDQTIGLYLGWWGVARYSTDPRNVARAQDQATRVLENLLRERFILRLPDGGAVERGDDARAAAGFLCRMHEAITGRDRLREAKIRLVDLSRKPFKVGKVTIPGFRFPIDLPARFSHAGLCSLEPLTVATLTTPKVRLTPSQVFGKRLRLDGPCAHLTAKHPGGHAGPRLPCLHLKKEHDHDWLVVGPLKTKVPCTHLVPEHDGHGTTLPCAHLTKKHPQGHRLIDADATKLDVEIPLGELIPSYSRHMFLVCMAFEPKVDDVDFLRTTRASSHPFAALLRAEVETSRGRNEARLLVGRPGHAREARALHAACPPEGPHSAAATQWFKDSRWIRSTDLTKGSAGKLYNGLDFLSYEVLLRATGL